MMMWETRLSIEFVLHFTWYIYVVHGIYMVHVTDGINGLSVYKTSLKNPCYIIKLFSYSVI